MNSVLYSYSYEELNIRGKKHLALTDRELGLLSLKKKYFGNLILDVLYMPVSKSIYEVHKIDRPWKQEIKMGVLGSGIESIFLLQA